jgi:hypothetical protein
MSKIMKQVMLQHTEKDAGANLTTWLEKDPRIKKGVRLTLKDDDREWTVLEVYDLEIPFDQLGVRGFDNNNYDKHDGTALKDRAKK